MLDSIIRSLSALLLLVVSGPLSALSFEDVSHQAGFMPGHIDNIPGGGIAVADFNGNGYPDIFVTGGTHFANRLYFNQSDGTFLQDPDINQQLAGENCAVTAAADYNNSGWPDIYVGCRHSDNKLFEN